MEIILISVISAKTLVTGRMLESPGYPELGVVDGWEEPCLHKTPHCKTQTPHGNGEILPENIPPHPTHTHHMQAKRSRRMGRLH